MISHKRQFIFVHIPKTAGTTFSKALDEPRDHKHSTLEMTIRDGLGRNPLKKLFRRKILGYFKFAVVRNPWDRAVSLYMEKKHTGWLNDDVEFSDFIEHVYSNPEMISKDPNLRFHCRPCHHWLTLNGKFEIDFVGRFEQLQADFDTICHKINLQKSILPILRKRDRAHYSTFYDEETRKIVADHNQVDIDYFAYRFEQD